MHTPICIRLSATRKAMLVSNRRPGRAALTSSPFSHLVVRSGSMSRKDQSFSSGMQTVSTV